MTAKPPRSRGTTGKRRAIEFARGVGAPVDADLDESDQARLRLARAIEEETRQRQRENRDRASIARGLYPVGSIPPGVPLPESRLRKRRDQMRTEGRPNDRGYVEAPTDASAYVPAKDILQNHMPRELGRTHKHLLAILDRHSEIKRWRPRKNRLCVHLADWCAYLARRSDEPAAADGDAGWAPISAEEVAARAALMRPRKSVG